MKYNEIARFMLTPATVRACSNLNMFFVLAKSQFVGIELQRQQSAALLIICVDGRQP